MESIVHILVRWSQVCACKIKSDWNAFTFDRCAIHYFKFIEILSFSDRILSTSHNFFSYYAQLHMLDFDSHQVEKDLTQNAIFQMEFATIKLKLNMKAFFDTDFHFNWSIVIWLSWDIWNDKFLFLCNPVIVSIDNNIDIISESNDNSIIAFELFFYTIELKIIRNIVGQSTWWLEISHDLQERGVLVFIIKIFNDTDEFNSYSEMIDSLVFVKGYLDLTFNIFPILYFRNKKWWRWKFWLYLRNTLVPYTNYQICPWWYHFSYFLSFVIWPLFRKALKNQIMNSKKR